MDSNSWQILTLDNLTLRGHTLVNQCCMCCCNEETVDYLLLHFLVAHSLWVHMLQFFWDPMGHARLYGKLGVLLELLVEKI